MPSALSPSVSILSAAFFALLFLTSFHPDYGHYADEFNYIACAERPDLGYVDHPPLAPLLLAVNRAVLGDSLPALRLLPALCGALTALLAAWMARRLGGGAFAQMLAALCITTAPLYVSFFSFFSTNCFEIVAWTLVFWTPGRTRSIAGRAALVGDRRARRYVGDVQTHRGSVDRGPCRGHSALAG